MNSKTYPDVNLNLELENKSKLVKIIYHHGHTRFEEDEIIPQENIYNNKECKYLKFPFQRSPVNRVHIGDSKILVESDGQSADAKEIWEILIDSKDFRDYDWQPGDTIGVIPVNEKADVAEILERLNIVPHNVCSISSTCLNLKEYIPSETTPQQILRECLNIDAVLKKVFLKDLAVYCEDNMEKSFLRSLGSKEGSGAYNALVLSGELTLLGILRRCVTCRPPLELIIYHLPKNLPRPYSIASSPLNTKDYIKFIFSTRDTKPGKTTKMLKEKCLGELPLLYVYLRTTNCFRYGDDNYYENQILIAIGTGLAPFLAFLEHKELLMNKSKEKAGITWLFVGTTNQQSVIDRENLLGWQSKNVLNNFVESYSRTSDAPFQYIQEALEHNASQLIELLMQPETCIYLCADGGKISESIEMSLKNILAKKLAISEEESAELLKDFQKKMKYRKEVWI